MEPDAQLQVMLDLARQRDPSIEVKPGMVILRACEEVLADEPNVEAPDLARRVLARYRHADPSWTAHLATVAVSTRR
jgi:hypothetical protein